MDQFQMAIAVMTACDVGAGPRDAEGRRRQYTVEELDTLAEFAWPLAGVAARLAGAAHAIASGLLPCPRPKVDPALSPSAEAVAGT
jgi:hypothetical protein